MTSISRYRHFVTLERPVRTTDTQGGSSVKWKAIAREWASISPFFSDQRLQAGRAEVTATHIIQLRRDPDVRAGDRLDHEGTKYEVVRVKRDPGKWSLEVWGREVVP